ncbi:MAG: hypothetical protein RLZZ628_2233 [Bacteroidota bacterium]|jgi:hypothetical protein
MNQSPLFNKLFNIFMILGIFGYNPPVMAQLKRDAPKNATLKAVANTQTAEKTENHVSKSVHGLQLDWSPELPKSAKKMQWRANYNTSYAVLKDSADNYNVIEAWREGFLTATERLSVAKYDKDFNPIYQKEINLGKPNEEDEYEYTSAILFNDKLYLRSDYYDKAQHKHSIVFFAVQADGSLSQPIPICAWEGKEHKKLCQIYISKNQQHLLITKRLPMEKEDTDVQVELTVLDKNLNKDWTKTAQLTIEDEAGKQNATRYGQLNNTFIDNEGRVFFLKLMKEREKFKVLHHLELNQFSKSDKTKVYPLDLEDKSLGQFTLLDTERPNEIICTGTFERKPGLLGSNDKVQGTYFFRLNTDAGIVTQHSINDFSKAMCDDSKSVKNNEKLNIYGVKVMSAYLTPNGNTILLMEQQRATELTSSPMTKNKSGIININYTISIGQTRTAYYSENIFAVKYSETGQLIAQNMVPRSIMNVNTTDGLGYIVGTKTEKQVFFYNDFRKNNGKNWKYRTTYPSSSQCMMRMSVIDDGGKAKISDVLVPKKHKSIFNPAWSVQNTDGSFTTLFVSNKHVKLLKLKF